MVTISKSQRWIVECLKAFVDQRSVLAPPSDVEWSEILDIAGHQRLESIVEHQVEHDGLKLPSDIASLLKQRAHEAQSCLQGRLRHFNKVTRLFGEHGVPLMPLKGMYVYLEEPERFMFRRMSDIDILVRPRDLENSLEILANAGYKIASPFPRVPYRNHHKIHNDIRNSPELRLFTRGRFAFFAPDGEPVDLHWSPSYEIGGEQITLDGECFWSYAEKQSSSFYKPSPHIGFLLILVHAADASNPQLMQLGDLMLLQKKYHFRLEDLQKEYEKTFIGLSSSGKKALDELFELIEFLLENEDSDEVGALEARFIKHQTDPHVIHQPSALRRVFAIPSMRVRLVYLLGFLLPDLDYYNKSKLDLPLLFTHWVSLVKRQIK